MFLLVEDDPAFNSHATIHRRSASSFTGGISPHAFEVGTGLIQSAYIYVTSPPSYDLPDGSLYATANAMRVAADAALPSDHTWPGVDPPPVSLNTVLLALGQEQRHVDPARTSSVAPTQSQLAYHTHIHLVLGVVTSPARLHEELVCGDRYPLPVEGLPLSPELLAVLPIGSMFGRIITEIYTDHPAYIPAFSEAKQHAIALFEFSTASSTKKASVADFKMVYPRTIVPDPSLQLQFAVGATGKYALFTEVDEFEPTLCSFIIPS